MTTPNPEIDRELCSYVYENCTGVPKGNVEYEKMISGCLYDPNDPELVHRRFISNDVCKEYNEFSYSGYLKQHGAGDKTAAVAGLTELRNKHLEQKLIGKMGKNVHMEPPFYLDYGYNIILGNKFYCNFNATFLDTCLITIGDDVMFGPNVSILTASHPLNAKERNSGVELAAPITIGDGCWLAANVTLLPGVTIGKRCVIAAGAVVSKSFGDDLLIGGVPAKAMRQIE